MSEFTRPTVPYFTPRKSIAKDFCSTSSVYNRPNIEQTKSVLGKRLHNEKIEDLLQGYEMNVSESTATRTYQRSDITSVNTH